MGSRRAGSRHGGWARNLRACWKFLILLPVSMSMATDEDLPEGSTRITEQVAANEAVRILMIGGSSVASYPEDNINRGWGQTLPQFFDDRVSFRNAARSGRSSKSFREEGDWERALEFKPDFVLIQFGHNDQPGKGPHRETDPETTFPVYLKSYIQEVREIGGVPVLVTPVARRTFRDGRVVSSLGPWAEAKKKVAIENGVPLIDLHGSSIELFNALGEEGCAELNNGRPGDRTHFSEKGATEMARLVAAEIPEQVPGLAPFILEPALLENR